MLTVEKISFDRGMGWYGDSKENADLSLFIVMTYGKCLFRINGKKVIAEKGDFLYVPAGSDYYGKSVPTVFHEKLVYFLKIHVNYVTLPLLQKGIGVAAKAGCFDYSVERLRSAAKEWEEDAPYASVRNASVIMETLVLWSRELDRGEPSDICIQHTEKMKAFIGSGYREKVTKELLGDCIGRSPNYAASLFRRMTGQTISEYVHAVRMRTAVYMLTESLLSITEISEYLGYTDVSYFQRLFKRQFGVPPSHYLKERPKGVY
jgi:AraC family transcriptional regulator of arabinose operon